MRFVRFVRFLRFTVAAVMVALLGALLAGWTWDGDGAAAQLTIPAQWKNCTAVHKRYPHGVGKANARDKTSGEPVTTFKRSTRLYRVAIGYNARLDRDHDGIACEQQ